MVKSLDDNVGRILKTLKEQGLTGKYHHHFSQTTTADKQEQGQSTLRCVVEKGRFGKGGVRVPMAIKWHGKN